VKLRLESGQAGALCAVILWTVAGLNLPGCDDDAGDDTGADDGTDTATAGTSGNSDSASTAGEATTTGDATTAGETTGTTGLTATESAADSGTDTTGDISESGDTGDTSGATEPVTVVAAFPQLDATQCPAAQPFNARNASESYRIPALPDPLTARLFPLIALFAGDAATQAILTSDADAVAVTTAVRARAAAALTDCAGQGAACFATAMKFTADERTQLTTGLAQKLTGQDAVAGFVTQHLWLSGVGVAHIDDDSLTLVAATARDLIDGLEAVYDSHAGNVPSADFAAGIVQAALDNTLAGATPFSLLADVNRLALLADDRNEAVRYEPLAAGTNAPALAAVATTDFNAFPFSAIIVPGIGPSDLTAEITQASKDHCDMAAARFKAGVAPFILTSGGHVNPDRTPYSEAVEMKKYLMNTHGVPPAAILIDPYARHTTTNIRNASRILFRGGFPVDKPVLVTTNIGQSVGIQGPGFVSRNLEELGYVPYTDMHGFEKVPPGRGSTDSCFRMTVDVLRPDPRDALDP
jgi:hypothetical protein